MSKQRTTKNNKKQDKKKSGKDSKDSKESTASDRKEPVAPKAPKLFSDLPSALAAYRIPCAQAGSLRHFLAGFGVPTYFPEVWHDPNPSGHPVAHTMRLYSVVQCMRDLAARTKKNTLHVLDYYGRDWRSFRLPASEEGVAVVFHPYRPAVYAGDPARAVVTDTPAPASFDAVIAVDIYLHENEITPFGATEFGAVVASSGAKFGYVVTQDLSELFGQHVYQAVVRTEEGQYSIQSREGSWESVTVAGLRHVVFTPDKQTVPYPPHAYVRFSGTEVVPLSPVLDLPRSAHFHQMGSSGYYQMFVCAIHEGPWKPVALNVPVLSRYVNVPYGQYAWQRNLSNRVRDCLAYVPKTWFAAADNLGTSSFLDAAVPHGLLSVRGLVAYDSHAVASLSTPFLGKTINGRVVSSMLSVLEKTVDQNQSLADRYPQQRAALVLNSLMVYLSNRPEDEFISASVAGADPAIDAARREFAAGKPVEKLGFLASVAGFASRHWWKIAVGALAVVLLKRARGTGVTACSAFNPADAWLLGRPVFHNALHYGVTAVEEVAKCYLGFPAAVALNVWETLMAVVTRVSIGAPSDLRSLVITRAPATALHFATTLVYKLIGPSALAFTIPGHWAFNYGVLAYASQPGMFREAVYGSTPIFCQKTIGLAQQCLGAAGWFPLPSWCMPLRLPAFVAAWLLKMTQKLSSLGGYLGLQAPGQAPVVHNGHHVYSSDSFHDASVAADVLAITRSARWTDRCDELWHVRAVLPLMTCMISPTPCVDWVDEYFDRMHNPRGDYCLDWRHAFATIEMDGITYRPAMMQPAGLRSLLDRLDWSTKVHVCEGLRFEEDACPACAETPEGDFMFPLAITPGLLHKPSSSPRACVTAFFTRWYFSSTSIEQTPRSEVQFHKECLARLAPGRDLLRNFLAYRSGSDNWVDIEECAAAMPTQKGKRLLEGYKQDLLYGNQIQEATSKGAPKANETIKADFATGEARVKPRAIIDVDPTVQAAILPKSRTWTKELKRAFDGSEVMTVGKYRVRFVITKAKKKNLDSYAALAATVSEMCVFVSCDDTILFTGEYETEFGFAILESDYSSYDQTQRMAFWKSLWHILGGDDLEWTDLHDRVNVAPASYRNKRLGVKATFPLRYAMRTGVGTTSIFGSVNNIQAYIYWLLERRERPLLPFATAASELGLVAKVSYHRIWETATFLKGYFTPTGWNPLVSCCLKLSKSGKRTDCPTGLWYGIMQSVKVPDDYPLLGAMKRKAAELVGSRDGQLTPAAERAVRQSHDVNFIENRYKVLESSASRADVLFHMLHRYGIDEALVVDAENQIASIRSLPVLLVHPIYDMMRTVDYN